jgi:ABC-type sugar transport system ATPase subunit
MSMAACISGSFELNLMVSLNNQTYAASPFAWQMRGTSKLLRGISAPEGVDFDLRVVKVVAPVGETRVGKPTLMNISSGAHRADELME